MDKKAIESKSNGNGPIGSSTKIRRKRKRFSSSSGDEIVLADNALETERKVSNSAVKNNLDETSVRKILKKVVTNDRVLALVKLREEEAGDSGSEDKDVQPKLTRSKVKELKRVSPKSGGWNLSDLELTPIESIPVKTRPEVTALISHEMQDDEDDPEYEPTPDDVPSDDDHDHSCSDLDSQPRTPATPRAQCTPSPLLKDGPFKVPSEVSSARRKLNVDEEEATIALRTRSKLSLSTTTIETLESTFVPPDAVQPPVDNLWSEFLSGVLDPAQPHDDDEDDPEYNAAADADAVEDEEDFLGSSLRISKKELSDLVTELFNVMPTADEDLSFENLANSVLTDTTHSGPVQDSLTLSVPHWEGKVEPLSDDENLMRPSKRLKFEKGNSITRVSVGKTEPLDMSEECERIIDVTNREPKNAATNRVGVTGHDAGNRMNKPPEPPPMLRISIEERNSETSDFVSANEEVPKLLRSQLEPQTQTMHIELQTDVAFTPEQLLILQQQLRIHIQLAASNFLQVFIHPVHWRLGPTYREYLETLKELCQRELQGGQRSVVAVCNLLPAVELVAAWGRAVADDTPENKQIVEFMNTQVSKSKSRYANNCLHVGDFHDKVKEIIATSSVFLYPYLLPAVPYKADITKRIAYLRSEDHLIVLGLDQFWEYMAANKDIFPPKTNSRHRWGLATATQLVSKHMLPWLTAKQVHAHVIGCRSAADKDNPIYNYLKKQVITPVQHTILPFDPNKTLYDQPEHEMPRLWVRHLALTSKRFKRYLNRRHHVTGQIPTGVPIRSITQDTALTLPNDFTKEIICTRNPTDPMTNYETDTENNNYNATSARVNDVSGDNSCNGNVQSGVDAPLNMYRLVNTSNGSYLLPINVGTIGPKGNTVITKPADHGEVLSVKSKHTPGIMNSNGTYISTKKNFITIIPPSLIQHKEDHCTCCVLLRKLTKRQTVITDYFLKDKEKRKCYCSDVQYPQVTNKLRLLANNFKLHSGLVYNELERRLNEIKRGKGGNKTDRLGQYTLDELVSVTTFQLKVVSRSLMSKFSYLKVRCKNLLTRFNPDKGDPVKLANALFKTCGSEMVDLYLDFLEFLTSEQADRLDKFKDYFVRNCAKNLMDKIEEQVTDRQARSRMLSTLQLVFSDNTSSSCEICSYLLETMAVYPTLAEYTFSLFPHSKHTRTHSPGGSAGNPPVAQITITQTNDISRDGSTERATTPLAADTSVSAKIKSNSTLQSSDSESEDETRVSVHCGGISSHSTRDHTVGNDDGTTAMTVDETLCEDQTITSGDQAHQSEGQISPTQVLEQSEEPIRPAEDLPTQPEDEMNHEDPQKENEGTEAGEFRPIQIKIDPDTTMDIDEDHGTQANQSYIIRIEEVKDEPAEQDPDWKREEDKLILQVLKHHLTAEERKENTIQEMLDEKNVLGLISQSMAHRSKEGVKERVLYILSLLVLSES